MLTTKKYHRELIEQFSRRYDILELQQLGKDALVNIASGMNITVGDALGKQTLIYKILEKQSEL